MMNVKPETQQTVQVLGYTDRTQQLQENRIRMELEAYIKAMQPMFGRILIHNNTKTANVTVAVSGGVMHITITDPEEPYKEFKLQDP